MSYKKFALVPYDLYKTFVTEQSIDKVCEPVSGSKLTDNLQNNIKPLNEESLTQMGQLNCGVAVNMKGDCPLIDTPTSQESAISLGSGFVNSQCKSKTNSNDSLPTNASDKAVNRNVEKKKIKKNEKSSKEKLKKKLKKIVKKDRAATVNWLRLF